MYAISKLWKPELFQGGGKRKNYFEGWYFKMVNQTGSKVFAIIPGIAYGKNGEDAHAFIQVIDGISCHTNYIRFDIADFHFSKDKFEVEIGNNFFSANRIKVNLKDKDFELDADLHFRNLTPYPGSLLEPGVMGWFTFVPFMECYHGIVSLHHQIKGSLVANQEEINFDGGIGYIEKDWGRSFPSSWIWMQTNHFQKNKACLSFSIAKIPWMGNFFSGFLGVFWFEGKVYKFTTYTGAKIKELHFDENNVRIILEDKKYRLEIDANRAKIGVLQAPLNGIMERRIQESISATVNVKMFDSKEQLFFEDEGRNTGLEVVGDIKELLKF